MSSNKKWYGLLLGISVALCSYAQPPVLKNGTWQAVLQRPDGQPIIFNFETSRKNNKQVLYILNASERLLVDSIEYLGDSIHITLPFFAAGLSARIKKDGNLEGLYIKNYGDRKQLIPFYARYGVKERYPASVKASYNVSGRWAATFGSDNAEIAVGEFKQAPNGKVTGTFLTPTGDYRFLEGTVSKDSLKLSAFDGGHAILFAARLDNDSTISSAAIFSGLSKPQVWQAHKDVNAALPDGYAFTKLRPGETKLNFRFPSVDGDTVSINDDRYKSKVVIVQLLGSWCPNCMDETAFLSDYYSRHRNKNLAIIGLAYERTTNFEESKKALASFRRRFNVPYPFLVTSAAVSDPKRTEKTLPQLEQIKAFPTTIFIDKQGNIRKIHSGFNGPGTGEHYEAFKKEFDELVTALVNE